MRRVRGARAQQAYKVSRTVSPRKPRINGTWIGKRCCDWCDVCPQPQSQLHDMASRSHDRAITGLIDDSYRVQCLQRTWSSVRSVVVFSSPVSHLLLCTSRARLHHERSMPISRQVTILSSLSSLANWGGSSGLKSVDT